MANGIVIGSSGKFLAELLDNGTPVALPSGSTWAWSTDDTNATITVDPSDATGATIVVALPATDTNAKIGVTASTVDPAGATQTNTLVVPDLPPPQIFTVQVTQVG